MGCTSTFGATRAYEILLSSTAIHQDDRTHMFTLEIFTKGFYILGFDLTPDREADEKHISFPVREKCALRHGSKNAAEPVTSICMQNFLDTSKSTNLKTAQ